MWGKLKEFLKQVLVSTEIISIGILLPRSSLFNELFFFYSSVISNIPALLDFGSGHWHKRRKFSSAGGRSRGHLPLFRGLPSTQSQ